MCCPYNSICACCLKENVIWMNEMACVNHITVLVHIVWKKWFECEWDSLCCAISISVHACRPKLVVLRKWASITASVPVVPMHATVPVSPQSRTRRPLSAHWLALCSLTHRPSLVPKSLGESSFLTLCLLWGTVACTLLKYRSCFDVTFFISTLFWLVFEGKSFTLFGGFYSKICVFSVWICCGLL